MLQPRQPGPVSSVAPFQESTHGPDLSANSAAAVSVARGLEPLQGGRESSLPAFGPRLHAYNVYVAFMFSIFLSLGGLQAPQGQGP